MITIKYIGLVIVFVISTVLGITISNKYKERTKDLKTIRNILNILETKIKYTYEPLPSIFNDISNEYPEKVGEIFKISKEKMKDFSAGEAWHLAIENSNTSMNKEDLSALKNLEKLLGKTNVEGQLSEIELMKNVIDTQIKKSEEEQSKNEKLYKNLGIIVGLAIVIILA